MLPKSPINFGFLLIILFTLSACKPNDELTLTPIATQIPIIPTATQNQITCIDARQPTPLPDEKSLFPKIDLMNEHIRGNSDASVTLLVYSDYQCVSCASLAQKLTYLQNKYPDEILVVFRNFPLESIHDKASIAARASESAALQNKFWEMHDFLFFTQKEWEPLVPAAFQKWIIVQSATIGLDAAKFEEDINSENITSIVENAWTSGQRIKLPGAPVILINGEIIKWQIDLFQQLENYVKLAILSKKQFTTCPPFIVDPAKSYTARMKTTRGEIIIKLFKDKAPKTVNNFVFLAKAGWFTNNPFFIVVPGYIVETGDPSGTGFGGPGYFFATEKTSGIYDRAGLVGMLNAGVDTNGSQFFITLSPMPKYNKRYPLFGEVTQGLEILSNLHPQDPSISANAAQIDGIISITIEEK